MSENESGTEKTEQPTEKRLREARAKGQIPRSREFGNVAIIGAGAIVLLAQGASIAAHVVDWMKGALTFDRAAIVNTADLPSRFGDLLLGIAPAVAPLVIVGVLVGILAPNLLGGFQFSSSALAPNFGRINPMAGLKRMWGKEGLVELVKATGRFVLLTLIAYFVIEASAGKLVALTTAPLESALGIGLSIVVWTLVAMAGGLALIAALDVPYQLYKHKHDLMMTREEVRQEMKESEGSPEVKGKIRRMQHQMSQRRMMEDVPKADVIVVNPTHYAVALKYEQGKMRAPKVVAKGVDLVALAIRGVAETHRVPILSAPPLARTLYREAEIGADIPVNLYAAVAQVLTYVYQLRNYRKHGGAEPAVPTIDFKEPGNAKGPR